MPNVPKSPRILVRGFRVEKAGGDGVRIEGNPAFDIDMSGVEVGEVGGSGFNRVEAVTPSIDDLRRSLAEEAARRIILVGKRTAEIQDEACAMGALGNPRLAFSYLEVLEEHWRQLVSDAIRLLDRFITRTSLSRTELIEATRHELTRAFGPMKYHSKLEPRDSGLDGPPMPAEAVARIDALETYMAQRLRALDIGIEGSLTLKRQHRWDKVKAWMMDFWKQLAVALIVAFILVALGLGT